MSDEITGVLESYIHREERLLTRLSQLQSKRDDLRTELGREAVKLVAREALGRTGGKIVRTFIDKGDKQYRRSTEAEIDTQHHIIVNQIRSFLGTISEWRKNLKGANSDRLQARLDRSQSGVRVATRIRNTIKMLTNLKSKRLVYNKDIPVTREKAVVLPPGRPFTGLIELLKVLSSATEYVKVCDPWVGIKTLEVLLSVPNGIPIKLLTSESGKAKRFRSACVDFRVERSSFDVRVGEGLHDRFILTKNQGWLLGSSIKDFGKKFSALTSLQESDTRETERIFNQLWRKAESLLK